MKNLIKVTLLVVALTVLIFTLIMQPANNNATVIQNKLSKTDSISIRMDRNLPRMDY